MTKFKLELTLDEIQYLFRIAYHDSEDFDNSLEANKERYIFTSTGLGSLCDKLNVDEPHPDRELL